MINFFKDREADKPIKADIQDLQTQINTLTQERDHYKQLCENYFNESRDVEFEVDFDSMTVFSIERMNDGAMPKTVLGYWIEEPVTNHEGKIVGSRPAVKEWVWYCSHKRHNELVEKFRKWKKNHD